MNCPVFPIVLAFASIPAVATAQICDPILAASQPYGMPTAGTFGDPFLSTDALPFLGEVGELRVSRGLPGAPSFMLVGRRQLSLPIFGVTLLVDPILTTWSMPPFDPLGLAIRPVPIPPAPNLCGLTLTFQNLFLDPGAQNQLQIAHSNGIEWRVGDYGGPQPPVIFGVNPPGGNQGDIIQILGQDFDPDPRNNCVFLGDFSARAVVLQASPNMLTAQIGPIGRSTTAGEVLVARGSATALPNHQSMLRNHTSVAELRGLLVNSVGQANVGFMLAAQTAGSDFARLAGRTLTFNVAGNWQDEFKIDIYVRDASGRFTKDCHVKVNSVGSLPFDTCVDHIRDHLQAKFPNIVVTGAAATGAIVMSDPSWGPLTSGSVSG